MLEGQIAGSDVTRQKDLRGAWDELGWFHCCEQLFDQSLKEEVCFEINQMHAEK